MTRAKVIIPGQTLLTSIKTLDGRFYIAPDRQGYIKNLIGYHLGCSLRREQQVVHAFCAMSNHVHYVHTDIWTNRSAFIEHFHREMAKKFNQMFQRKGTFWARSFEQWLMDKDAMMAQLLYTWLNPVKACLVDCVVDWDHFMILPKDWGKPMTFQRPEGYPTDREETWPTEVTFVPLPPPYFQDKPLSEVQAFFETLIQSREVDYQSKDDRHVVGMEACYDLDPYANDRASSSERTLAVRRTLEGKALVARAENKRRFLSLRRPKKTRERVRAFYHSYRCAINQFKSDKSTPMPYGVYYKYRVEGCCCLDTTRDDIFYQAVFEHRYMTWFWANEGHPLPQEGSRLESG